MVCFYQIYEKMQTQREIRKNLFFAFRIVGFLSSVAATFLKYLLFYIILLYIFSKLFKIMYVDVVKL